ncbi:tetratricopeptide repeat protein [Nordella sp. HKS 07]|nr:adenylate/guanylate cyclase domain-containing protein [Nordella sp. HKS 07]QIG52448.1 tetratricopeptide repeat protein [Nordella sp. HKS 07]
MAADVVGYSRLMEANEERTLAALRQLRREFFDPTIARHRGRIFKTLGDGFLIEFGSVTDATRCAVEVQSGMPDRNTLVPEDRHIRFRVGIHVGDMIVEGDEIYGDAVNIAARLEGLAAPGGIACSAAVRDHIGNKLDIDFSDQGNKAVKNIAHPLHVYFVNLSKADGGSGERVSEPSRPHASAAKPSVAILPFANISSDAEQEFFSDGITEDLITDLSKVSGLQVLSRNTVFTFKGKAQNLQQTARQLGVEYLVEGSVRKSGSKVRITAQLIEGATDHHVWAERYDRDLTDIFAVQDEITRTIVEQLRVRLLPDERAAIEDAPTQNVEAYTNFLKGKQIVRIGTRLSLIKARQLYARALELDPSYAQAYVGLANCASYLRSFHGFDITIGEILATVDKALQINPALAEAHAARGIAFSVDDRREEVVAAFEKALQLDPNNWEALYYYGRYYFAIGDFKSSLSYFMRAMEVQPEDCESVSFTSQVLQALGRSAEAAKYAHIALKRLEQALRQNPENPRLAQLMANNYAYLGQRQYAEDWIKRAFEIDPDDNHVRYNAACVYALLGEFDKSFDLLDVWVGLAARDARLWFLNDPDFSSMRQHPRYKGLLKQVERP